MASNFDSNPDSKDPSTDTLNPQQEQQQEPKEGDDNNNSQGNFFEENKSLLTKVYNILKLKFPNVNISLSELITAAQKYIDTYANNPGNGDGASVIGESDEDINAIVRGFCKIYKTDWEEFKDAVLNGGSFEEKTPDESFEKELYIDKNVSEFKKQDELRIKEIEKAVAYIKKNESISNDNEIKQKLVEFCLNDKTAVLNYIEYLLKVFYDKWLLPDGSGDRFPYVIHPTDTSPRNTEELCEEYKKVESEIEKIEKKSSYSLYANVKGDDSEPTLISNYVEKEGINEKNYQNLKKDKQENYIEEVNENEKIYHKINNEGTHIIINKKLYENTNENITWFTKDEKNIYNETYNIQLYGSSNMDANSRFGKGAPDLMYNVSSYLYQKSSSDKKKQFKKHLHDFGIGVDCSGYVSRALSFVMNKLQVPIGIQIRTLGPGYGRVKSNCTTLATNCNETNDDVKKYYFQDSATSGSYLLLTKENVQTLSTESTKWFNNKEAFFNYMPFIIPNTGDENKQIDQINDLILINKLEKKFNESKKIYGAEIKKETLPPSSTKLQPGDIITRSNSSFHVKIVSKVNNDSYSHQQSTSVNRTGVIESTIDAKKIKEEMKNYWFARPYAFSDDKKLIELFKNMLLATGKQAN